MKSPLPRSAELLEKVLASLGPKPPLIGIDGPNGAGKTSLASWLAWQLGTPAVYLDLYVIRGSNPLQWRIPCLQRIVTYRLEEREKPIVIEGIMLLEVLANIGRKADFLVYVDGKDIGDSLPGMLQKYRAKYQPERHAQFRLNGCPPEDWGKSNLWPASS
jgi:uridine kinase